MYITMRISFSKNVELRITMLPLDLLRELITLLDDASTYRTFALASRITSQLCQKNIEAAKKRFTVFQTAWTAKWYQLPNSTLHGPNYDCDYQSYCTYLDGRREGRYDEWYIFSSDPKYLTCTYVHGVRHGRYIQWEYDGTLKIDITITQGVPEGPYVECGRGMRLVTV